MSAQPDAVTRDRIARGELKQISVVLPLETGIKVSYLCEALQCDQAELFARLIMAEWVRQGEPVRSD